MLSIAEINVLVQSIIQSLHHHIRTLLSFVGFATLIQMINSAMGNRLCVLGIYPRSLFSVGGIVLHPWIHGGMGHLIMNAIMFLIMGSLVAVDGILIFYVVSCTIIIIGGVLVWLFGRPCLHVGASGLVLGYWGFLIAHAYADPQFISIVMSGVCLYFFWGLISNLFPSEQSISWEGHIFGFIAGILTSLYLPTATITFLHVFPNAGSEIINNMINEEPDEDIIPHFRVPSRHPSSQGGGSYRYV